MKRLDIDHARAYNEHSRTMPMAATHQRRRLKPLVSRVSVEQPLVPKKISRFKTALTTETPQDVIRSFSYLELTAKQIVFRMLQERGPWTTDELHRAINQHKPVSLRTVIHAVRELKNLGLAVRANGAWAIHNWKDVA